MSSSGKERLQVVGIPDRVYAQRVHGEVQAATANPTPVQGWRTRFTRLTCTGTAAAFLAAVFTLARHCELVHKDEIE